MLVIKRDANSSLAFSRNVYRRCLLKVVHRLTLITQLIVIRYNISQGGIHVQGMLQSLT